MSFKVYCTWLARSKYTCHSRYTVRGWLAARIHVIQGILYVAGSQQVYMSFKVYCIERKVIKNHSPQPVSCPPCTGASIPARKSSWEHRASLLCMQQLDLHCHQTTPPVLLCLVLTPVGGAVCERRVIFCFTVTEQNIVKVTKLGKNYANY